MASCRDIEDHLAAYVDGQAGAERSSVEAHLERCPACRARVAAERATHELLMTRQQRLRGCAPGTLRQRCAAQRALARGRSGLLARRTLVPLSVAATVILAAAVFLVFGWGSTVETYAAQLAVDHVKCRQFPPDSSSVNPELMGRSWEAANGWPLKLAPAVPLDRLELVGIRRCGSSKGRVAHIFYRWRGEPLSVYVLNDKLEGAAEAPHDHQRPASVTKFGEQAVIWSDKGRTYAVVAAARTPDLEHVAAYVRRTIE
jgi:anti-sigma factor RsiW